MSNSKLENDEKDELTMLPHRDDYTQLFVIQVLKVYVNLILPIKKLLI